LLERKLDKLTLFCTGKVGGDRILKLKDYSHTLVSVHFIDIAKALEDLAFES
jgi:hypothetical protein